jgi:hypothetical protein
MEVCVRHVRFAPENRHAAAPWTGGGELDEDGNLYLPDLTPEQLHRWAMAQLILAVLALDS